MAPAPIVSASFMGVGNAVVGGVPVVTGDIGGDTVTAIVKDETRVIALVIERGSGATNARKVSIDRVEVAPAVVAVGASVAPSKLVDSLVRL
jgi:hypothetical protein